MRETRGVPHGSGVRVAAEDLGLMEVAGVPLGRWTGPELAAELAARGLATPMPASSVLRILAEHPVKPRQYRSWIYPATRTSRPRRR